MINPIFDRDTNRTVCSLHLWPVPCILCSHTCTYTGLHREAVTFIGGNSHDKSTVRREGVWVVIQLLQYTELTSKLRIETTLGLTSNQSHLALRRKSSDSFHNGYSIFNIILGI